MLNLRKGDIVKSSSGDRSRTVEDVDHYEKKMTLNGINNRVDVGPYILVTPTWAVGDRAEYSPDAQEFVVDNIEGTCLFNGPVIYQLSSCKRLAIAEPPAINVTISVSDDDGKLRGVIDNQIRGHRHPIETVKRLRDGNVQIGKSIVSIERDSETVDRIVMNLHCFPAAPWGVFNADELRTLAALCIDMARVLDA